MMRRALAGLVTALALAGAAHAGTVGFEAMQVPFTHLPGGGAVLPTDCTQRAIYMDPSAGLGERVRVCVVTGNPGTWVGIDNPFGAEVDATELANTLVFAGSQVLNFNTNSADLRLAVTATNPANAGSLVIDSTSNELEWYAGAALRQASDYVKLSGRPAGQTILGKATSDPTDDGSLNLAASGASGDPTRGAYIGMAGNENGLAGAMIISAGNAPGALDMVLLQTAAGKFSLYDDGDACLGYTIAEDASCVNSLGFNGQAARTIGVSRQVTNATAGSALTISAGGGDSGSNNNAGGSLVLSSGQPTGQGKSHTIIQGYTQATASGSGDQTAVDRALFNAKRSLTDDTATAVLNVTVASNTMAAGRIKYAVESTNGTDFQTEVGSVTYTVVNKAGVFTTDIDKSTFSTAASAGTLVGTWAITGANPAVVSVDADTTTVTPSAGYPRITFSIENLTDQAIAVQ